MNPIHNRYVGIALCICLISLSSCDSSGSNDEPDDTVPLEATLSSIQSNVFSVSCASSSCHDSSSPARGLDLSSASRSFAELVDVASVDIPGMLLVSPGNPDDSYLIWKLEGNSGIRGGVMPIGSRLSSSTIDVIREWITNGALNN